MKGEGRKYSFSDEEDDSQQDGCVVGSQLLRLGKLQTICDEVLVIEAASPAVARSSRSWTSPRRTKAVPAEISMPTEEDIEQDLLVEEFGSEDESEGWRESVTALPPVWKPGDRRARTLMQARAQQCVVCMEEKEHTFVPEHREEAHHCVWGHRFCTECWEEFLFHSLEVGDRLGPSALPTTLSCPVCRGNINVPDVWAVDIPEIPDSWLRQSLEVRTPSSVRSNATPAAFLHEEFWAEEATGRSEAVRCAEAAAGASAVTTAISATTRPGGYRY